MIFDPRYTGTVLPHLPYTLRVPVVEFTYPRTESAPPFPRRLARRFLPAVGLRQYSRHGVRGRDTVRDGGRGGREVRVRERDGTPREIKGC